MELSEAERTAWEKFCNPVKSHSNLSRRKALELFQPPEGSIMIISNPKSGTTWMQQIVHGLRSRGDMEFEEICDVIPYIELAHDYGYTDLLKDQGFSPKAYKAHTWYKYTPKGDCKYIFVIRNPVDAARSYYHFMNGWFWEKDSISFHTFMTKFYVSRGAPKSIYEDPTYWDLLASWYPHRKDENVLWVHYEDMLKDLPGTISMVSNFTGIGQGDTELHKLVEKQASFDFMKANSHKFNEVTSKKVCNESLWGLPPDAGLHGDNAKVRKAKREEVTFSEDLQNSFHQKWDTIMKPVCGFGTYDEMRDAINKELGRT